MDLRWFWLKSSKWTERNAMLTCDCNGSPSEIMTAINSAKEVMFMAFSFTLRPFTFAANEGEGKFEANEGEGN